jgi:ATP-dependent DNA helicase RecG
MNPDTIKEIIAQGRGLPMVFAEAKNLGKTVKFEEIGEEFKVTLEL